jgi:hypothetical protein
LSVALTPAFAQVLASARLSRAIQENLTASMLAQEGMELVRGIRDDNWFQRPIGSVPFDDGLDNCDSGCRIELGTDFLLPLDGNPPLQIDAQSRYLYDVGSDSIYSRRITVTQISPVQLHVVSEVSWATRSGTKSLMVEGYLFDWLNL